MINARITILACAVGVVLPLIGCDGSRRPPDDVQRMEPQFVGPSSHGSRSRAQRLSRPFALLTRSITARSTSS